jgi:hypothetical protein
VWVASYVFEQLATQRIDVELNTPKRFAMTPGSSDAERFTTQNADIRGHTSYLTFASAPASHVAGNATSTTDTATVATAATTQTQE